MFFAGFGIDGVQSGEARRTSCVIVDGRMQVWIGFDLRIMPRRSGRDLISFEPRQQWEFH